jgi:TldD protein
MRSKMCLPSATAPDHIEAKRSWELHMTDLAVTDALFFDRTGMDPIRIEALVDESLAGMDDGELYLEYSQSESLALDDRRIKSASFDTTQGFGLRAVAGEAAGYARASELAGTNERPIFVA